MGNVIDPADIVRFVDGTLPEDRRAEVDALLAGDPDLAAAVKRQQRAAALIRDAAAATEAPLALRERLAARSSAPAVRRRRGGWLGALAAAAAAVLLALVVALPDWAPGGPSIVEAADLGTRPIAEPAPVADRSSPALLARTVDGVPFPAWDDEFGWRAVGARSDELDGRRAVTVFYAKARRRLAYTIVAGASLPAPEQVRVVHAKGTRLSIFERDGRTAVTWTRRGRTCVMSGAAADVLVRLAAWRGEGAVPF